MVEDILDKIVVPDVKSTKADVFKKEERKEKEEHREEKYKEKEEKKEKPSYINEKKEIFRKGEFDTRKPVSFNIKTPGLIERSIYVAVILILFYFAFFQNANIDLGNIFGSVQPLVVKEANKSETTQTKEIVTTTQAKEETKETELSGEITFTVDEVKTEKAETGVSKITGFTFTIDNQKKEFDAKLLYYAYDSGTPVAWKTKERGESFYAMPVGKTTKTVDKTVVFATSSTKTMRFEVTDKNTNEVIANITKEVIIS